MKKLVSYALAATFAMSAFVGVQELTIQKAHAVDPFGVSFSGVTASAGVNVRSGPGTNYPIIASKPGNVTVYFSGLEYGTITPDVWFNKPDPRWFYYIEGGQKKYIASAVVDGLPPKASIRPKDRAVAWAVDAQGRTDYNWYCQMFVENTYGTTGQYASAIAASNNLNTGGSLASAPIGSLVFFAPASDNGYYGHVGIYIGQNTMINAQAVVRADNIATSSYFSSRYTGWGYAPSSWPGHY
ncbi:NlpC/P60 family protein [Tumebacillus permanentifrigoris]|uniref:NlpC/P60 family protein n=1 Tax=Tumebacillus permanentifrigoris TaxID=378543 RepID=A0A316DAW3_9BACL|nr:NlpC/P60 family protein [Tumebacillus permanentifrigoris]PWK14868.1 NlpC/P60 family protein [Tumebacillus permanentifrigoris]